MNLDALAAEIRARHGCHTLILYGSRARGAAGPDSDWDLLGIRRGGPKVFDARPRDGSYLDIVVHPQRRGLAVDLLHVRGGRVLFQANHYGDRLLASIERLHAAGPPPLSADETAMRRAWARKMARRAAAGDAEGDYRRAWLLTALLEDYFVLRGRWFEGPKAALAELASQEPEAHAAFAAALTPGARLDAIDRLVEVVLAEAE